MFARIYVDRFALGYLLPEASISGLQSSLPAVAAATSATLLVSLPTLAFNLIVQDGFAL
jgi:hypothetical protein